MSLLNRVEGLQMMSLLNRVEGLQMSKISILLKDVISPCLFLCLYDKGILHGNPFRAV